MRPIDADALIDEARKDGAYGYVDIYQIIDAPTLDVAPVVHGEWIDAADEYDMQLRRHMYICSICGKHADSFVGGTEDWWTSRKPNYCPNCGAKMDGERKEGAE